MNLFQSINSAMDVALQSDPSAGTVNTIVYSLTLISPYVWSSGIVSSEPRHEVLG